MPYRMPLNFQPNGRYLTPRPLQCTSHCQRIDSPSSYVTSSHIVQSRPPPPPPHPTLSLENESSHSGTGIRIVSCAAVMTSKRLVRALFFSCLLPLSSNHPPVFIVNRAVIERQALNEQAERERNKIDRSQSSRPSGRH
jgi:hypothetical protein